MNEHEDLISRLRAFGRRPVDTGLSARHLAAMAAVPGRGSPRLRTHRLRVVAAFAAGLLAGTTGLATAGALPDGAQEIAHDTLGSVGVNVPHGDRYQGPECGGAVKNHGQYVRSQPKENRAAAAASRCGKPLPAGDGSGDAGTDTGKATGCQGPPPWAGKGKPDQAAKDARQRACGDEQDGAGQPAPAAGTTNGDEPTPPTTATATSAPTPAPTTPDTTSPTTPTLTTPTTPTTPDTTAPTTPTTAPAQDAITTTTSTTTTTAPVPVPGSGS